MSRKSSSVKRRYFSRFSAFPIGLFGALVLGRKDDVADLAIRPARRAVVVQFVDGDGLAVHVFVALGLGFGLAVGHQFGQVGGRILGARRGREKRQC